MSLAVSRGAMKLATVEVSVEGRSLPSEPYLLSAPPPYLATEHPLRSPCFRASATVSIVDSLARPIDKFYPICALLPLLLFRLLPSLLRLRFSLFAFACSEATSASIL